MRNRSWGNKRRRQGPNGNEQLLHLRSRNHPWSLKPGIGVSSELLQKRGRASMDLTRPAAYATGGMKRRIAKS
eukprot:12942903-Alexandrium_andersonii.AAC.1